VVRDTDAIIDLILQKQFDWDKVERFIRENYQYVDGKASERLYIHIFKN
jgi:CDP-glycerol glycerophosphotransferase (TagB/SpsB family)